MRSSRLGRRRRSCSTSVVRVSSGSSARHEMRGARATGGRRRKTGDAVPSGLSNCFTGCVSTVAFLLAWITCGVVVPFEQETGDTVPDLANDGDRELKRGVRRPQRGSQGSRDGSLTGVAEPTEDTASGTTPMPDLRAATIASEAASQAVGATGFSAARVEGDHASSTTRGDAKSVRKGPESVRSGDPHSGADGSVNSGKDGSEVAPQNVYI